MKKISDAAKSYEEGSISYVEFVRYANSELTKEDVELHNSVAQDGKAAQWPFQG